MGKCKKLPIWEKQTQSHLECLRRLHNKTQQDIADVLGCTVKTYANYENKTQLPKTEHLLTLAKYFDVSTDYLLDISNCTKVSNAYISRVTGLNDNAIDTLRSWNKYQRKMDGISDVKHKSTGFIERDVKNKKAQLFTYRPLEILNILFSYELDFVRFLGGVRDLLFSDYKIPVYHTGKSMVIPKMGDYTDVLAPEVVPYQNDMDVMKGVFSEDVYMLTLARDSTKPWDNTQVFMDNDFFEILALKTTEQALRDIHTQYKENTK